MGSSSTGISQVKYQTTYRSQAVQVLVSRRSSTRGCTGYREQFPWIHNQTEHCRSRFQELIWAVQVLLSRRSSTTGRTGTVDSTSPCISEFLRLTISNASHWELLLRYQKCVPLLSDDFNQHNSESLATCLFLHILSIHFAFHHSRGHAISILKGPEIGWRGKHRVATGCINTTINNKKTRAKIKNIRVSILWVSGKSRVLAPAGKLCYIWS